MTLLFRDNLDHAAPRKRLRLPVVINTPADEATFWRPDCTTRMAPPQADIAVRPMPRWKRAMDVTLASAALLLVSPIILLTAIAIKTTSRGPAIFSQTRAGIGGRPFVMYKFRSMVLDAESQKPALLDRNEQDGPAFKLEQDPRTTAVGWFLRRSSIDELPQLWNVIKGDMSLVGPRPLPCNEADACTPNARRRLEVTPGITCTWQVRGRSRVGFAQWLQMDLDYIARRSITLDLRILLATIPAVLSCRGAR
jgi:lipopolysaccharide/colanic/teichoic acid biosynthesis glycosyltransferase